MTRNAQANVLICFLLVTVITGVGMFTNRAHGVTSSQDVIHCYTHAEGQHLVTHLTLRDGVEYDVTDIKRTWSPIRGGWYLSESPVKRGPRFFDCTVTEVNGQRTMVLTTLGGAEWFVVKPWSI